MDEGFFLFLLFCGFLLLGAIIWCFLSTCLGLEIRRSDLWDALKPTSLAAVRQADRERRDRINRSEYHELETMGGTGLDRLSGGMGGDEIEMMRRGGPGRFY
ncbi:hypothetical protein DB88DRAFT_538298 [Papiliotrema laurentii]|uniref:Uncharacterized protein n=1 Tax=Papiliotrema laurentii TaxID=5418 RepID=A0AAD9FU86_PAPLA|nr:hypothetical protein DB88DRAFT_538298 [Papiliotrema laurentii]